MIKEQNYEITFKVKINVNYKEVDDVRKENRNFLSNGFFKKDHRIAKVIAYDKAIEAVKNENESLMSYEIKTVEDVING